MLQITIVGGGTYGGLIAKKYKKFSNIQIRVLVSLDKPESDHLINIPRLGSAEEWKNKFHTPTSQDVFDLCVHQSILIDLLNEFINIGAKNFILPKPIALNKKELDVLQKLVKKNKLKITVASQWYYSSLVAKTKEFLKTNKDKISKIEIVFSQSFDPKRRLSYSAKTAFLPHIIQILSDLNLVRESSNPTIECISESKIKLRYTGQFLVKAESDINDCKKKELLNIYIEGNEKPVLSADFSGVLGKVGFISFPKIKIGNKETEIKEDILEKMIEDEITYFEGLKPKPNILTLERYLPVANQIIKIIDNSKKVIGIIGGGVFGILTALEAAKKGYSVVIFEKEKEVITGASLVNHGRIHMGYHYPRDKKTVTQSLKDRSPFEKYFGKSVVRKINHYYLVAKEGSLTNHTNFLKFCKKMHLPFKIRWPKNVKISKEKIAISVKVPETILDANNMRIILSNKISNSENITLLTNTEVVDLKQIDNKYRISFKSNGNEEVVDCVAVVNATYGGINKINNMLGLPLEEFQYELCEILVTSTPWKNTGWMIMDGPFFSSMPFGYSSEFLFYDVELSVLERVIDKLPNFKYGIDYYNTKERKAERFSKFQEKWRSMVGDINGCKYLYSMYVTRIVLRAQEKTDKRPTIVNESIPGYWQIFSGKITASVSVSKEIGEKIDKFIKNKK